MCYGAHIVRTESRHLTADNTKMQRGSRSKIAIMSEVKYEDLSQRKRRHLPPHLNTNHLTDEVVRPVGNNNNGHSQMHIGESVE